MRAFNYNGEDSVDPNHPVNIGYEHYKAIKSIVTESIISKKSGNIGQAIGSLAIKLACLETRQYPIITTRRSRRTDYLKAIDECFKVDMEIIYPDTLASALKVFRNLMFEAFKEEVIEENKRYRILVSEKNTNRELISGESLLFDAIDILKNPVKYKWTEVVRSLALCTGRRPSEILCSGKFEKISEQWLIFKGQAKRRNNYVVDEQYPIPSLCSTDLILTSMYVLEGQNRRFPYNPNEHVESLQVCDKKSSKAISRASTGKLSCKELRAVYGELSYQLFAPDEMAQHKWFTKVLGHDETQTGTSHSYLKYYVTDDEIASLKKLIKPKPFKEI